LLLEAAVTFSTRHCNLHVLVRLQYGFRNSNTVASVCEYCLPPHEPQCFPPSLDCVARKYNHASWHVRCRSISISMQGHKLPLVISGEKVTAVRERQRMRHKDGWRMAPRTLLHAAIRSFCRQEGRRRTRATENASVAKGNPADQ
jgi:hypothetical protein